MDKIGFLQQTDIFAGLGRGELDEIVHALTMIDFPKGRTFYRPGEEGEVLFVLKTGRVRIFRLAEDGRELTITELAGGTIFGEMALFGQTMHDSYAQALEDCLICIIKREAAMSILRSKPVVALNLAEVLGKRLLATENRLESLALKDVRRRLATLLLELADASGAVPVGDRRYTHEELAKMIGTSRESVTLALIEFKKRGWLDASKRSLVFTDRAALKQYAGA